MAEEMLTKRAGHAKHLLQQDKKNWRAKLRTPLAIKSAIILLFITVSLITQVQAASCEKVVSALGAQLRPSIDQQELIDVLHSLNRTDNKRLPPQFVTKHKARSLGWKPGQNLWSISELKGSSIGGDQFRNMEGRLPVNKWREADLDYKGGHRGSKRLIFSLDGLRFVTVDHYKTFVEIPSCR